MVATYNFGSVYKEGIKLFNYLNTHIVCMVDTLAAHKSFLNKLRLPKVLFVLHLLNCQLNVIFEINIIYFYS